MFRFTIRELVLLTLVVALGVAWWLDRSNLIEAYDPQMRLEGSVFRVQNPERLVDVRLGSDDGVGIGDRLDVYRNDAKIGAISLLEIEPDNSRGVIFQQNTPIQKGDKASIYLRHSDLQRRSKVGLR
jgi:hypothetical protein